MAATRILAPLLLAILINFKLQFYYNIYLDEDFDSLKPIWRGKSSVGCDVFGISFSARKCYSTRAHRHDKLRRPIMKWVKHGYILLAATDCSLLTIDITVFMDVETNPGPISSEKSYDLRKQTWSDESKIPCYGRNYLLGLRKKSGKPSSPVLETLKKLQLLRFRGNRGGLRKKCSALVSREHTSVSSGQLAVPKLLFINICSLGKTTSRVRAVVALEADLRNNDIDACVVSETHLKIEVPDTVVNISGYNIFRRDRNWSGCDLRNGEVLLSIQGVIFQLLMFIVLIYTSLFA
ncbi:unnamed protein product [Pocillopora meandrina]|uniref:Uncharacterized protein n=1 Tax=Pocillopora meandrina TaxID=46732 RepID=A0AAU9XR10_9CNID|nr:unnamed protein product [Pocillopora meandrina]